MDKLNLKKIIIHLQTNQLNLILWLLHLKKDTLKT